MLQVGPKLVTSAPQTLPTSTTTHTDPPKGTALDLAICLHAIPAAATPPHCQHRHTSPLQCTGPHRLLAACLGREMSCLHNPCRHKAKK
jgi:hypothetical protein